MSSKSEVKLEKLLDPAEVEKIAQTVREQYTEMGNGKLVDALKDVPMTVLRVVGDPTIKAVALIGYEFSDVTELKVDTDETTQMVEVRFMSKEADQSMTSRELLFSRRQYSQMFDASGKGHVNVALNYRDVIDGGFLTTISARIPSKIQEQVHLPCRLYTEQSIITLFSIAQTNALSLQNIKDPGVFAFVGDAKPANF